jgi:hypothetical protein
LDIPLALSLPVSSDPVDASSRQRQIRTSSIKSKRCEQR